MFSTEERKSGRIICNFQSYFRRTGAPEHPEYTDVQLTVSKAGSYSFTAGGVRSRKCSASEMSYIIDYRYQGAKPSEPAIYLKFGHDITIAIDLATFVDFKKHKIFGFKYFNHDGDPISSNLDDYHSTPRKRHTARVQGIAAFERGEAEDTNPYKTIGSALYVNWGEAWGDAEAMEEERLVGIERDQGWEKT
jgi:hypothetical protein